MRPARDGPSLSGLGILVCSYGLRNVFLLTTNNAIGIVYLKDRHTTSEVAQIVGIHLATLQRWIAEGKVQGPKPTLIGAVGYRLWSQDDIARLREVKKAIYCKGRGRKTKRSS
jgi:excisionase family DNA binding protein